MYIHKCLLVCGLGLPHLISSHRTHANNGVLRRIMHIMPRIHIIPCILHDPVHMYYVYIHNEFTVQLFVNQAVAAAESDLS